MTGERELEKLEVGGVEEVGLEWDERDKSRGALHIHVDIKHT